MIPVVNIKVVLCFFMIMARMTGLLFTAPVFSRKEVFMTSKVAFSFWTAFLLIYIVPLPKAFPATGVGIILAFVLEALIGVMMGFILDMFVTGIEFAGTLMDTQAGLSVASMLDPSSGRTITLISLILKWVALLIFLMIDGHHLVLSALIHSYQLLPIAGNFNISAGALEIAKMGGYIFYIGVKLAAPIMLVVFIIDFGFGILNRVAEQINVFQLGFQIKPSVSLFVLLLTVPGMVQSIYGILESVSDHLLHVFHALSLPHS